MQAYMQRLLKTDRATPEGLMKLKDEWGFDVEELVPARLYKIWCEQREIHPVQTEVRRVIFAQLSGDKPIREMAPVYIVFSEKNESQWFTVVSFDHDVFCIMCENMRKLLGAKACKELDFSAIPPESNVERTWKWMLYDERNVQIEECFDGPVTMASVVAATPHPHELCAVELQCERTLDQVPMTLYMIMIPNPDYWRPEIRATLDYTEFEKYMLADHKEQEIVTALSALADLIYDGGIQKACKL